LGFDLINLNLLFIFLGPVIIVDNNLEILKDKLAEQDGCICWVFVNGNEGLF